MLSDLSPSVGVWAAPVGIDPFSVPLEDKLALLSKPTNCCGPSPRSRSPRRTSAPQRTRKWFGSTEGAYTEQSYVETGAGIEAYAVRDGDVVVRSYPQAEGGAWAQAGWEYVIGLDLVGNAPRVS